MDFDEMKQWLDVLGVTSSIGEKTWMTMDEHTRSVFMSDVRIASDANIVEESLSGRATSCGSGASAETVDDQCI
jgi:hypothetical protein